MDDLLLFTPTKKSQITKLEDLLKASLKIDLRYIQRNVSSSEKNYSIWEISYLSKTREYVSNHCEVG